MELSPKKAIVYFEPFDVEAWTLLAQTDPDAFEKKRLRIINQIINNASPENRQRLTGLQFQIDMERAKAKTPLISARKISDLMWDKVFGEDGLMRSIDKLLEEKPENKILLEEKKKSAKVIEFSKQ